MDNKDKNDKKRLSRVELYDSPKSQKRSFLSRKQKRANNTNQHPATPFYDESEEPVHSRRRQTVDRPQKKHRGFFSRFFNGRHKGRLYKTILFTLLGILVVMIIIFAVKQQHPVNTDSTDTSVSSSSSHHSRKHRRSHSSDSDDDNYGENENQDTYQIPASRSNNNNNNTSQNQSNNNNQSNSNNNQSNQGNNDNNAHSSSQSQPAQQPAQPSTGGGQQPAANNANH